MVLLHQPTHRGRHFPVHRRLLQSNQERSNSRSWMEGEAQSVRRLRYFAFPAHDCLSSTCAAVGRKQVSVEQRPNHRTFRGIRRALGCFQRNPSVEARLCNGPATPPEAANCGCRLLVHHYLGGILLHLRLLSPHLVPGTLLLPKSFMFYQTNVSQAIKGASPTNSGVMNIPMVLALVLTSLIGGVGVTIIGYYTPFVIASSVLMAIGVCFNPSDT